MIELVIGKDIKDTSRTQYYLTELNDYDSFDTVVNEVLKQGPVLVDLINGIHFRIASFEIGGKKFKIVYHEDIGIYSSTETGFDDEVWIQKLLTIVVDNLNAYG